MADHLMEIGVCEEWYERLKGRVSLRALEDCGFHHDGAGLIHCYVELPFFRASG